MRSLQEVLRDWEAVIGLEVHTELTSLNTKMFCSCPVSFGAPPNTHVCPVCLGLPGTLPVPNRAAIEDILMIGFATHSEIMRDSMFYRKNYFYPDMTKNYQITQGPVAFCMGGSLDLEISGKAADERRTIDHPDAMLHTSPLAEGGDGYCTRVGITRIHMEEDAGKLVHVGGVDGRITGAAYSLVDYNRCGTALIELVTEPDLRTPEEARHFLQELRQIYLTLGISNVNMEEGSLRCDGNISLRRRGDRELGTKTELKNMNSFKNLHDGLAYEICRQAEVLEAGERIRQETRHWEPARKRTISMRVKESVDDYRLFPDPNLAPYHLSEDFITCVEERMPELPPAKRLRYRQAYGLPPKDAYNLASDPEYAAFFDAAMAELGLGNGSPGEGETGESAGAGETGAVAGETGSGSSPAAAGSGSPGKSQQPQEPAGTRQAAGDGKSQQSQLPQQQKLAQGIGRLLLNEAASALNAAGQGLAASCLQPSGVVALARLLEADQLSSNQGKEVLVQMLASGEGPDAVVERLGLRQVSDSGAIEAVVDAVIAANPDKVAEYQAGKTGLLGFFVGQAMRQMQGQGNPRLISDTITQRLS